MKKIFLILALLCSIKTAFALPEKDLADVRINSNSMNVLKKFGNPNEILVDNYFGSTYEVHPYFGQLNSLSNTSSQINWIYNFKNYSVKFKLDNSSRISSIQLEGLTSNYQTLNKIGLGSKYSDVLKAYGMPVHEYEDEKTIKLEYPKFNLNFIVDKNISNLKSTYRVKIIELNSFN